MDWGSVQFLVERGNLSKATGLQGLQLYILGVPKQRSVQLRPDVLGEFIRAVVEVNLFAQ